MSSVSKTPTLNERRISNQALRILTVDDDHDTVEMLSAILRDEGHIVHECYSGKEALQIDFLGTCKALRRLRSR